MIIPQQLLETGTLGTGKRMFFSVILTLLLGCNNNDSLVNQFTKGKKEGMHITINEYGNIYICSYKNDKLDGLVMEIDTTTFLQRTICNYRNGNKNGSNYRFYPSGKLHGVREWKDGRKTGEGADLFENGLIKSYKEFNENGYVIYQKDYDTSGKVINVID